MRKIIFISALITFYVLIFTSCKKKCESNELSTVSFTSTDLEIMPYNRTDTLMFKDSLGNTMIFIGGIPGSNYNINCYSQFPSNPDCQGDYFCSEDYDCSFRSQSGNIQITLEMGEGNPFHQNIQKSMSIGLYFNDVKTWSFTCSFIFNNLQLYNFSGNGGSTVSFNDSLKIGSRKFFSVYILTQVIPNETNGNLPYVYYTIKEGIVGLKEQGGKHGI